MQSISEQIMMAIFRGDHETAEKLKAQVAKANEPKTKKYMLGESLISLGDDLEPARSVYDKLNQLLGEDWWEWEQETVFSVLRDKMVSEPTSNKKDCILAIKAVCNSDSAFFDWYDFNNVALAFAGAEADFQTIRTPSVGMIINAYMTLNYIRPDRESHFSDEVLNFIVENLKDAGIYTPPVSLLGIIKKSMWGNTKTETRQLWVDAYRIYNQMVGNNDIDFKEEASYIQAARLYKAEKAAEALYGKGVM